MKFFEYPYVIITILAIIFLVMGLIGLYFTLKSVKTAKGTAEKSFCGLGKIETDFEKARIDRKNRCVVYISISFDSLKTLDSESKAARVKGLCSDIFLLTRMVKFLFMEKTILSRWIILMRMK